MNNCGPSEDTCPGSGIIPCACVCDNCEAHDMECNGCVNCDVDADKSHQWVSGIDPRWLVCVSHPNEAMVNSDRQAATRPLFR